ncbi:hypothetical protein EDD15DRAFT_2181436, partial [Pisolithus albus]
MALEKVGNKSNRWYYQCNYCGPSGPGCQIEGRDNKPLKHLLDHEKCPNASQAVRNAVRIHLATSKGGEFLLPEPVCNPGDSTIVTAQRVKKPVMRRQNGTLVGFMDAPLTPAQQDNANVKLFRFIVHANVPLSTFENWYFRNFMDTICPSYNAPSRYVL